MLIPKRVKRRKQHKGKMRGAAHKGNVIAYGEYGLVAEECGWIKSNQIEAARIAMTRFVKRCQIVRLGTASAAEIGAELIRLGAAKSEAQRFGRSPDPSSPCLCHQRRNLRTQHSAGLS